MAACLLASSVSLAEDQFAQTATEGVSPFSVQLEEAIYTEQVLGDAKAAQLRYQSLIEEAADIENIAGEATARLIQNLVNAGELHSAQQQLTTFATKYPGQTKWLAFAQEALGFMVFSPEDLMPVPWRDGEQLYYQRKNLGRHVIFHNIQTKQSGNVADAWQTESMFYYTDSSHRDLWQVLVEADTNMLIEARNKMMHAKGREVTAYQDKISIKDLEQNTTFSIPKTKNQYDQGLLIDVLRRLPYTQGYKTTISLLQDIDANITTLAAGQSVTVPAGDFQCYLIEVELTTNSDTIIKAKAWISDDRHRYLVRYEVGDITDELQNVSLLPSETRRHEDAKGINLDLPDNWSVFYKNSYEPTKEPTFLQPMRVDLMAAEYNVYHRHDVDWENATMDDAVSELNSWDYSWLKSYTFNPESVEHLTVNGQPAVRFQADVVFKTEPLVYYRVAIAKAPRVAVLSFFSHKDSFDVNKTIFDQIAGSVTFREE